MNPLARLAEERATARGRNDPWANLCTVASVNAAGEPEARVLVLRDLHGKLAIFCNASSPKLEDFRRTETVSVVVYLPTLSIQYRLRSTLEAVPTQAVHDSWKLRPDSPKRLDWLYEKHPQSTPIHSRDALLDALEALALPEPLVAPESALGFYLRLLEVERLDLDMGDGVHDRRRYRLRGDAWVESVLVP